MCCVFLLYFQTLVNGGKAKHFRIKSEEKLAA